MNRTTVDFDGPISVIEYGGTGPLMVCVHGLEGSSYNWRLIAPELIKTHTVVAPDLRGFGYTDPGDNPVSVEHNADVVAAVIKAYGGPAVLMGNSMGGLVSILAAGEHPDVISDIILIDPAGPVASWRHVDPSAAVTLGAPLIPGLGKRIVEAYRATRTAEEGVLESYRFVAADPTIVSDEAYADALEIAELRRTQLWSSTALVKATSSIAPYVLRKKKFLRALHRVSQPTLLVHGLKDGVIQVQTAKWIADQRPDWTVAYLEDLGHVAMIEAPEIFLAVINTWLDAVEAPSV
jgi:pimeloyl-ACP methyl ester carboxylesterase